MKTDDLSRVHRAPSILFWRVLSLMYETDDLSQVGFKDFAL